jgi:UDP-GlcNAc:undecaprenyl-phosphate/decaprenyl-phosphate GlcNAc-1-phosphate transferase
MTDIVFTAFATAAALSLALTWLLRLLARRFGLVAHPRDDRWHRRPTALLGGIGIAVGFSATVLTMGVWREIGPVVALALFVTALGLVDDLRRLGPAAKLTFETTAAAGALYLGYRLGWTGSLTADSLLTLVWLVGMANAFNLLDNMDGLAAGVAGIGAAAYLILALAGGTPADVLMLAAYAGATCGFLVFNVHPASIFMGDAGSLFLGFTLGLLAVRSGAGIGTGGASAVAIPLAILSVPIFDTALVAFMRSLAGRPISEGGRDHSSHRLVALGLPERRAVFVLWVFASAAAIAGLSLFFFDVSHGNIVAGLLAGGLTLFGAHLAQVRVYDAETAPSGRHGTVALVLRTVSERTRVLDVLIDMSVVTLAYYTAYRIRFDDAGFTLFFPRFLNSLPIVVAVSIASLWWTGGYKGVWRRFGLQDALCVLKGTVMATVCSVAAMSYFFRFEGYSRAVFVICGALTFGLLVAGRASFRIVHQWTSRARRATWPAPGPPVGQPLPTAPTTPDE